MHRVQEGCAAVIPVGVVQPLPGAVQGIVCISAQPLLVVPMGVIVNQGNAATYSDFVVLTQSATVGWIIASLSALPCLQVLFQRLEVLLSAVPSPSLQIHRVHWGRAAATLVGVVQTLALAVQEIVRISAQPLIAVPMVVIVHLGNAATYMDRWCGLDSTDYCGPGYCKSPCPSISPSPSPGPFQVGLPPLPTSPTTTYPTPVPTEGGLLSKPGGNKLGIIVGISVGVVPFLAVCIIIAFCLRRSGSKARLRWSLAEEDPTLQLEGMPEVFSYKQLSVATRAFSEESKLGQGGFGSVYRGVLPSSGIPVAVKKINGDSSQGEKEFMAEISIISRLRHRNLIQLQGWCKDVPREKYLLVYELMPNGSLDKILFEKAESQTACLLWPQRFNIVTGTAAAVDYLHQGWKQQVIHRDIKSSNIMLDEEWNAKLGDFGLARLVDHQRAGATTMVAGTYGYIAPEAAFTGRFTDKTDVYAFGAVVLEIACGRRAFSPELPSDEMFLVDWVWERLSENALLTAVDKRLVEYDKHRMEVVLIIGLLCSHPDSEARPSMQHVVEVLAGHVPVPSIQISKPAPVYSSNSQKFWIQALKSQSSSKSMSRSVSLVPTNTSGSTRGSSMKSPGTSSSGWFAGQTNLFK